MRPFPVIIALVILFPYVVLGFGDQEEMLTVVVAGSVWRDGKQKIAVGTSVEAVLNLAICEKGAHHKRVVVIREADGIVEQLVVAQKAGEKNEKRKPFKLRDGNRIWVPSQNFSAEDRNFRKAAVGPFFLINRATQK